MVDRYPVQCRVSDLPRIVLPIPPASENSRKRNTAKDAGLLYKSQRAGVRSVNNADEQVICNEGGTACVCSMPRGCYEPWGIFRKPLPKGMTVSECLRRFQTGGLRRKPDGNPFEDVIESERTPRKERMLAKHPSLKPQSFLRQIVHAALPLGEGILLDPFMGSGSTIAAARAVGYCAVGVEKNMDYYLMSLTSIPALSALDFRGNQMSLRLT